MQVFFQRLYDYRLPLNSKKCIFVKKELDVVGNNITQDGFQPLQDKVAEIRKYPKPKKVNKLRRFLGL